ncbi:hypothetical protein EUZ85_07355 [Hahella sp. KA22]|uniref:hypothetical protein n=1 Tax=Hahella sp. KA22 TaxID=1628392 RepID=UPI000FDD756B|nr:hypothetical protein [Hahella sp. KA22]AZZ90542.1 hypothetical protein ENC22_04805 [Hahella sp. KA22]QAY53912.1 hypothetical protein EUZ85_07355 [Hahella sp. KA22]
MIGEKSSLTAYYSLVVTGRTLYLPASDILYLAGKEEVLDIEHIPCIRFNGELYPVYGFREGFIPQPGLQGGDSRAALICSPESGTEPALALSCRAIYKLRANHRPRRLPDFMVGSSPIEGVLRHNTGWECYTSAHQLIDYFEKALRYELPQFQFQNVRLVS